jgi:GrpB-like predicted nucleotidyltransferase (UPF0157 family)
MVSIEIVPYRPDWPREFELIGAALRRGLGDRALAIHHIGSTSVPGLAAKDVIDVQVSLDSLDLDQEIRRAFGQAGFPVRPDAPPRDHLPLGTADRPGDWSKTMAGQRPGERRVHIHIRVAGRPNQRYPLLFGDYLRADPTARATCALIKTERAARHAEDIDAYYAVKDPVCDLIVAAAESWAHQQTWRVPPSDASDHRLDFPRRPAPQYGSRRRVRSGVEQLVGP